MLRPWRDATKGTISPNNLESAYESIGPLDSKFRIQIIDGIVYGVPPKCCLGSPKYSDCCTPKLGRREKHTISQLWQVINVFYHTDYDKSKGNVLNSNGVPNVDFLINAQDQATTGTDIYVPVFSFNIKSVRNVKV